METTLTQKTRLLTWFTRTGAIQKRKYTIFQATCLSDVYYCSSNCYYYCCYSEQKHAIQIYRCFLLGFMGIDIASYGEVVLHDVHFRSILLGHKCKRVCITNNMLNQKHNNNMPFNVQWNNEVKKWCILNNWCSLSKTTNKAQHNQSAAFFYNQNTRRSRKNKT